LNLEGLEDRLLLNGDPPQIVDNGTSGYSETGLWAAETVPSYGGSERYATSSGTGQNTAAWQVPGLSPGYYQVQASWHPYPNQAPNAPYAIYDGATLLQTVPVNQTLAPSGPSFGGVPFQTLVTVKITSGTLNVVLSNTGGGTYIVADAMREVPMPVSSTDVNWSAAGDGITAPASVGVQSNFTISRTYTVSGAAAPANLTITYYASSSPDPNQDLSKTLLLGSETLSAAADLAVGDHSGTSPAFQFASAGSYYLIARLSSDSFVESDADNDTNNVTGTTQPQPVLGPVTVDNGTAGYSETGAWTSETVPSYGGNERYAASSGTGQNTATWQASGLAAALYQVQATWHPYGNQATNAPYAIYDGGTLLRTVLVNQTKPASGPSFGGVPFQVLATLPLKSGTLSVVLSNTGNGTYVVADAVRVVPIPLSNTDLNWSAPGDGISGPTTVSVQIPFTIARTYSISGAPAPAAFTISYYASTSADASQDLSQATLLGSETLTAAADLAVGDHTGTSPLLQLPNGGKYYLVAALTADPSWAESDATNETNDVTVAAQPVQVSGPVIVDNGTVGYSETGVWTTEAVSSYGGTERYAQSSGTGNNTAAWQVTGLSPGRYQVQVTWHEYGNEATNAPYAIYDGATLLQTIAVNQTQPPSGASFGGVPFQTLASVNITSGTLRVVLSNAANSTYIVADAVRVVPVLGSNSDLSWAAPGDGIAGAPASISVWTPFTVTRTYTVSGAAAPDKFTIAYYASTEKDEDVSEAKLLATETVSAAADLAMGNHTGTSPLLQLPNSGDYYLLAVLTADPSWAESDSAHDHNNATVTHHSVDGTGATILDNGDSGYSETGTWTTEAVPSHGGTERYAAGSGTGKNTATWQFTGLKPGQYQVLATWHPYYNQPTNAPYFISDHNKLLQTVLVDQTQAPIGPSNGGVSFQVLTTVIVKGSKLDVTLSDIGDGTWVVADAIALVPIG
jgi:hypothetical protein